MSEITEMPKRVLARKWTDAELDRDLPPGEFIGLLRKELPKSTFDVDAREEFLGEIREILFAGVDDGGTVTEEKGLGLGRFSKKAKCVACIAGNAALGAAIAAAVVALAPGLGAPAGAAAIAAKFGISLEVASAAVNGATAARLAYKMCPWCK